MKIFIYLSLLGLALGGELWHARTIYQWPKITFFENLAVRPNGNILMTRLDSPRLMEVNPFNPGTPEVLHEWPEYRAVGGIVETEPEQYVLVTGNFTLTDLDVAPGTYAVWRLDYRPESCTDGKPAVSKIADIPAAGFADGIAWAKGTNYLYIADADWGVISKFNIKTGSYETALNNSLTRKCHPTDFEAANGLKVFDGHLWWTNSGCGIFCKVPLDRKGNIAGEGTIASNPHLNMDDLAFTPDGTAFLGASFINQIVRIQTNGSWEIVAGNLNSTEIAEPTAMQFGRTPEDIEKGTLYIVTGGARGAPVNGTVIVGGGLFAIDTKIAP